MFNKMKTKFSKGFTLVDILVVLGLLLQKSSKLINKCVLKFFTGKYDIVTNVHPRTFPKGQSIEIINTSIFAKELKNIIKFNKEHFTQIFYKKKKLSYITLKTIKI